MPETLGFIGLGNMGAPIAANLLEAGYGLRVYNRTAEKAAAARRKRRNARSETGGRRTTRRNRRDDGGGRPRTGRFVPGERLVRRTPRPRRNSRFAQHDLACYCPPPRRASCQTSSGICGLARVRPPRCCGGKALWICASGPAAAKQRAEPIQNAIGQGLFDFGEDPGARQRGEAVRQFYGGRNHRDARGNVDSGGKKRREQESGRGDDRQIFPSACRLRQPDSGTALRTRWLPADAGVERRQSNFADGRRQHHTLAARQPVA